MRGAALPSSFCLLYQPAGLPQDLYGCRRFTGELTAHKTISPWSKFCKKWGANLKSLRKAYRLTRDAGGLVHAVKPPVVKGDMYSV